MGSNSKTTQSLSPVKIFSAQYPKRYWTSFHCGPFKAEHPKRYHVTDTSYSKGLSRIYKLWSFSNLEGKQKSENWAGVKDIGSKITVQQIQGKHFLDQIIERYGN